MSEYKGTDNPDKKRGELLKDNMSTGDYFPDRKGVFVDTPGVEDAQKEAAKRNAAERRSAKAEQQKPAMEELKKTVMPFKKGGKVEKESKSESKKEMAMDKKQDVAMIKKAFKQHDAQEHKGSKGTTLKLKKGGSVRGCGIASKGLTKGKIV